MLFTRRSLLKLATALPLCSVAGTLRAAASWPDEREAGAFRVHADFSLAELGDLLKELAQLQDDLVAELGIAAAREEVHLFLFNRRATYTAYLQQHFPKIPARKALYIKGRGPGMVYAYRSEDLEIDVRHESTHALLHASLPSLPLWLDEGLAEYYEVPAAERVTKNPYVAAVRSNARLGIVPDLTALEKMRDLSDMGRDEYRDAWSWVHYLLNGGKEPKSALVNYLRQTAAGVDAGRFSDHLRRHVADSEGAYLRHFRRWDVAR